MYTMNIILVSCNVSSDILQLAFADGHCYDSISKYQLKPVHVGERVENCAP